MARKQEQQAPLKIVGRDRPQTHGGHMPKQTPKGARIPLTFDAWWLLTQQKKKLRPELKEAVKKHLEARGFMKDESFDEGLLDFGIKS